MKYAVIKIIDDQLTVYGPYDTRDEACRMVPKLTRAINKSKEHHNEWEVSVKPMRRGV